MRKQPNLMGQVSYLCRAGRAKPVELRFRMTATQFQNNVGNGIDSVLRQS